jgi:hypothetical protein
MNDTITFPAVRIHGDGSSIWGPSKGTFIVDKMLLDELNDGRPYELQLFTVNTDNKSGQNTEWHHYTDNLIQREVNEAFLPQVRKLYPNHRVESICWSESGMQPKNGWSFDICLERS